LTESQQRALGVGRGDAGSAGEGPGRAACVWGRFFDEPQDIYTIRMVTAHGAEDLLGGVTGASVIQIAGFAAVETQTPDFPANSHCLLGIDVAAGQSLYVIYDYDGSTVPMTRELACEKARVAAEMAVQTLIEQSGA
jgi:hypothetical protein